MSALAPAPRLADGWRRPPLRRLIGAVLGGEVLAVVLLWVPMTLLEIVRFAPVSGQNDNDWVWLPWRVDGPWALAGAIAWGYLICLLVAIPVAQGIERRGYGRPAAAWVRISIAVSGYGAMAIGQTSAARVVAAVLAGAVVIRLVAFNSDGTVRSWRWRAPLALQIAVGVAAALISLSYTLTHSFMLDGSGISSGSLSLKVGHSDSFYVSLAPVRLPVEVTSVTLTGTGIEHYVTSTALSVHPMGEPAMRPPYHLAAGRQLWVTVSLKMSTCGLATVSGVRIRYTVLGTHTGETITLPTQTLACSG